MFIWKLENLTSSSIITKWYNRERRNFSFDKLSQLLKLSTNIKSKEGERERRPVCFVVVRQSNGQWAGERPSSFIYRHLKIISTAGKCSNLNDKQMRFSASSTGSWHQQTIQQDKKKTNKTRHWWRMKEKPMSWYAHTYQPVFLCPPTTVSVSIYKSHQPFYEQNSYFLTCCLCCDFWVVVEPAQLMGAWEKGLNNIRHLFFSCRVATSYRTPSSLFKKKK
jgi:hypothetical protein